MSATPPPAHAASPPYDPTTDPTLLAPPLPTLFPPFHPPLWNSLNDSLRGGLSTSTLRLHPAAPLRFAGTLYTALLGAGFASHYRTFPQPGVDLAGYTHVLVALRNRSEKRKTATLVLRDDIESDVSFEGSFAVGAGERKVVRLRWEEFVAMRRGKEVDGKLDPGRVRRVGVMVRSFFGKPEQEGPFEIEVERVEVGTE